eukprot:g33292.t1
MKPDGSPDINLGTGKDNGRNSPVDTAKLSSLIPGGLVPKLEGLSYRLVKQQPDIGMLMGSYLTDNVADTTITIPEHVLSHWQDRPSRAKLFHYSYNTDIHPTMWKSAQVFLVHEKQDKSNSAKYYPVSLLSIIIKMMESVINSAIKQHLLSHTQYGLHQSHSTPDLNTALVQTWTKEMTSRGEVRVTALDIKVAFDRVWHHRALAKLESMGIRGQTLWWLESYLTQRKMVVAVG